MRILQVTTSMDSRVGGPPAVLNALTPVLSELGHSSEFVTCEAPSGNGPERHLGCPIHRLGPPSNSYQFCPALEPWIKANAPRFDMVFVHGLWQHHGLSTRRALAGTGVPYFVYTHGMLDPWFKRTYPLKHIKKWIYWNLHEKRVLKDAAAVLFTCEEERQLASQSFSNYSCTERVVEFGTARPDLDRKAVGYAFKRHFPELTDKPYLLFLSRIHPKKGLDLLLRAYGEQCKLNEGAYPDLMIAGPCSDSNYLEELKALETKTCPAGHVHWTGMIEGDIKWGAILNAEAFVLSSHQENFGIAVAEAMALGKAVLISNKVNIWREIVKDGGGLAAEDDFEGTLSLLRQWRELPEAARQLMGTRALASFEQRFEIKAVAQSLIETTTAFLRRPPTAP